MARRLGLTVSDHVPRYRQSSTKRDIVDFVFDLTNLVETVKVNIRPEMKSRGMVIEVLIRGTGGRTHQFLIDYVARYLEPELPVGTTLRDGQPRRPWFQRIRLEDRQAMPVRELLMDVKNTTIVRVRLVMINGRIVDRDWTWGAIEEGSKPPSGVEPLPWMVGGAKTWTKPQEPVTFRIVVKAGCEDEAEQWLAAL
jgi:hypothetical protein